MMFSWLVAGKGIATAIYTAPLHAHVPTAERWP